MSNDWNPVLLGPRTSSPSNDSSQIDGREILHLAPGGKGWNCREITRSPTRYCDQEIRDILAQRFDLVVKSKEFTDELKKFRTNQGLNGQEVDLTVVLTKTKVKVVYDGKTHTLIKDWGSPKTIKKANAIYEAHKYHFCGQCDHAHSRTSSTASSHSNDHHEEPQPPHHPSSSYSDHNSEHSYDAYSHASSSPSPRPPQTPTSYSFDTSYPDDHYSYSKTTSQLPNDTTSSNHSGSPTNSDTSSDGEAVAARMRSEATPPPSHTPSPSKFNHDSQRSPFQPLSSSKKPGGTRVKPIFTPAPTRTRLNITVHPYITTQCEARVVNSPLQDPVSPSPDLKMKHTNLLNVMLLRPPAGLIDPPPRASELPMAADEPPPPSPNYWQARISPSSAPDAAAQSPSALFANDNTPLEPAQAPSPQPLTDQENKELYPLILRSAASAGSRLGGVDGDELSPIDQARLDELTQKRQNHQAHEDAKWQATMAAQPPREPTPAPSPYYRRGKDDDDSSDSDLVADARDRSDQVTDFDTTHQAFTPIQHAGRFHRVFDPEKTKENRRRARKNQANLEHIRAVNKSRYPNVRSRFRDGLAPQQPAIAKKNSSSHSAHKATDKTASRMRAKHEGLQADYQRVKHHTLFEPNMVWDSESQTDKLPKWSKQDIAPKPANKDQWFLYNDDRSSFTEI